MNGKSISRRFIKNSAFLAAIIIPIIAIAGYLSEFVVLNVERQVLEMDLEMTKTGTLRRIKSAVDSIEFLGFALKTVNSKTLEEKLIRDFLYSQHYFEEITLVKPTDPTTLVRQQEGEVSERDAKSFASRDSRILERSPKHENADYFNIQFLHRENNKGGSTPKLTISKSIPEKPDWMLVGVIDLHDLMYPLSHKASNKAHQTRHNSFACVETVDGRIITINRDLEANKNENSECNHMTNKISKAEIRVHESALWGKQLLSATTLNTTEASKIDLLGHISRPHIIEKIQ